MVDGLGLPLTVTVTSDRFRPEIESNVYFVVAEALTNMSKHAGTQSGTVTIWADEHVLHVDVRDDGVGGADVEGGGLRGIADRVAALGGRLRVESPPGGGTRLTAEVPLERERPRPPSADPRQIEDRCCRDEEGERRDSNPGPPGPQPAPTGTPEAHSALSADLSCAQLP